MKTKIVIKLPMNDQKSRSKAMKISVGISGVESTALTGEGMEVVGVGVDPVELTRQLRKNVAYAELVSVGEAKKEQTTDKAQAPIPQPPVVYSYPPPYYEGYPHYPIYEMSGPSYYDPFCTIMW